MVLCLKIRCKWIFEKSIEEKSVKRGRPMGQLKQIDEYQKWKRRDRQEGGREEKATQKRRFDKWV